MLRGWVGHITTKARLSEWSKEPDLRPGGVSLARSNRAPCKTSCIWVKYTIFSYSVVVITLDFESSNPDSTSGGRILLAFML